MDWYDEHCRSPSFLKITNIMMHRVYNFVKLCMILLLFCLFFLQTRAWVAELSIAAISYVHSSAIQKFLLQFLTNKVRTTIQGNLCSKLLHKVLGFTVRPKRPPTVIYDVIRKFSELVGRIFWQVIWKFVHKRFENSFIEAETCHRERLPEF